MDTGNAVEPQVFSRKNARWSRWLAQYSHGHELLWLATGVVVVSGCVVALALAYLRAEAVASGTRLTESDAQVIAEQTSRTLQAVEQRLELAVRGIAQRDSEGSLDEATARAYLQEQIKTTPFVDILAMGDANGRLTYASYAASVGVSIADRAYFEVYRAKPETGFYVGPPTVGRVTGKWTIGTAIPRKSGEGAFLGIALATLKLDYVQKTWSSIDLGTGGSIALFRRDGTLMMRAPFDAAVIGKVFASGPIFKELLPASSSGSLEFSSAVDGARRVFAYRTLPGQSDLVVIVGRSIESVLAPWFRLAMLAMAIWLAASIAIITLCAFLGRAWRQRAMVEARIKDVAERLRLATEAGAIGVWDWNLRTKERHSTETGFTMLGYSAELLVDINEHGLELVHPEDRAMVLQKITRVGEGVDTTFQCEARVLHASGIYRWISVLGRTLDTGDDKKPIRVGGVTTDVTERKSSEIAAMRLAAIVEASEDAIIGKDLNSIVTTWNRGAEKMFGYPADEIVGTSILRLVPADRIDEETHIQQTIARGERVSHFDTARQTRDGRLIQVSVAASPIFERMGAVVGVSTSARDITDRKLSEAALRASEQRYRELFDSNPQPMWVVDVETLMFLAVNDAAIFNYGYSREEFLAMTVLDVRSPDDVPPLRAYLQTPQAHEPRRSNREWRHRRKDGSIIEVEVSAHVLTFNGRDAELKLVNDVTARNLATEKLRISEENLAITLNSIGDGVIATDASGNVKRMNATAQRLTGWTLAEAEGRPLREIFHTCDSKTRMPTLDPVQKVMEHGEVVEIANHTALLSRDGREYQIADSAAPIRNAAKEIVGVVLVFSDVTEQYKVRAALERSSALLERIGEMAKVGGWELDVRTMVPYWSLETARIHEVDNPTAPVLSRAIEFYAPEARTTIQGAIQAAIENATPWDMELPLTTAKDRNIWVRTQCSVVVEDGKAVTLLGALHDITERKLAEVALIESEARYRRIVNAADEGIWLTDTNGLTSFVNTKMAQMLGYSQAEMLGQPIVQFLWHDGPSSVEEIVLRRLPDISERHDLKFARKAGGMLWGLVATNPIFDASGNYTGTLTMIADITERKEAEAALRQSVADKEALLKEVHHRVKNNLQVINSLLRLEIARLSNDGARTVLSDMQGRIRAMALLHDTLYRSGTFAAVDLSVYVRQLVVQINRALNAKSGQIQTVFNVDVVQVGMDQAIPCGLLVNELVSNAFKHGFPDVQGGEIRIDLHAVDGGPQLRLRVSDTGVGLASDFEARRKKSLGLQLVSDLAGQLGGHLEIGAGPMAEFAVTFTPVRA